MTEFVILPGAKYRVLIFTCECDLTPIVEQPILVTQKKKGATSPLRSNSDSGPPLRALFCQTFTLPVGYVSRIAAGHVRVVYSRVESIYRYCHQSLFYIHQEISLSQRTL